MRRANQGQSKYDLTPAPVQWINIVYIFCLCRGFDLLDNAKLDISTSFQWSC